MGSTKSAEPDNPQGRTMSGDPLQITLKILELVRHDTSRAEFLRRLSDTLLNATECEILHLHRVVDSDWRYSWLARRTAGKLECTMESHAAHGARGERPPITETDGLLPVLEMDGRRMADSSCGFRWDLPDGERGGHELISVDVGFASVWP